ncbi:MAG: aminoacyl-tRNA hydrolase [Bacteroidales bacterium]|nr:aminoacyl-tRNA hydrolase [Bacteroidales bacterium]
MNFLVAGLGNIGPEYALTRHNMGFMILDSWAQESGIVFSPGRYGSTAQMSYKGRRIYLLKPSTYMNLSGNAVRYWQRKYKIPLSNLIVICDDINLPFGTMRLRKGGSAGGHNGLEHIELCLGTKEYARIRLGIGKEFEQGGQIDYVLGRLSEQELAQIPEMAAKVLQGVREFCTVGADFAMNSLNIRPGKANI